jgi:putative glutamine amidotransferase
LLGWGAGVRMVGPMAADGPNRPKIGIPWRTSQEEVAGNLAKTRTYMEAVELAGGEAVLLSLAHADSLQQEIQGLDGFVLPGSPADVSPSEYGTSDCGKCAPADRAREETDRAILSRAFNEQKPVLAICYGCQLLNVYLGGTLIQDITSEKPTLVAHRREDVSPALGDDPFHEVSFTAESQLAKMAEGGDALVNSSHHQSIGKPGRQLRITGQAADGIVESVEWTGDANWVIGVQWHPERMKGDVLAERLFSNLVAAARKTAMAKTA